MVARRVEMPDEVVSHVILACSARKLTSARPHLVRSTRGRFSPPRIHTPHRTDPHKPSLLRSCAARICSVRIRGARALTAHTHRPIHRHPFPRARSQVRFLESSAASVRAAAAVTLIRLGWGIGIGGISETALLILEQSSSSPPPPLGPWRNPPMLAATYCPVALLSTTEKRAFESLRGLTVAAVPLGQRHEIEASHQLLHQSSAQSGLRRSLTTTYRSISNIFGSALGARGSSAADPPAVPRRTQSMTMHGSYSVSTYRPPTLDQQLLEPSAPSAAPLTHAELAQQIVQQAAQHAAQLKLAREDLEGRVRATAFRAATFPLPARHPLFCVPSASCTIRFSAAACTPC